MGSLAGPPPQASCGRVGGTLQDLLYKRWYYSFVEYAHHGVLWCCAAVSSVYLPLYRSHCLTTLQVSVASGTAQPLTAQAPQSHARGWQGVRMGGAASDEGCMGGRRLGALRRKLRPLRASDRRGRAGEGPALRPDAAALVSETTAPLAPPRLRPRTHNALDHNAELRRGGNERYNVNSHEGPSSCRPGLAIEL